VPFRQKKNYAPDGNFIKDCAVITFKSLISSKGQQNNVILDIKKLSITFPTQKV